MVVVALISTISLSVPANACPVCVTLPEASLADHLNEADVIVLARPDQDNPFRFVPHELIKGTDQNLERLPPIPFLVDSTTRASFRNDPEVSILFTYGATDKDAAGRTFSRSWKRIFTLTPERSQFLTKLRNEAEHWPPGSTSSKERVAFFLTYVTDDDPILRDTALIELDRAPYLIVKSLRPRIPADALLQEFRSVNRISFVPVSIRLMGLQTDDAKALAIVRDRYPRALGASGGYPYEWALAGIEVDGPTAVSAIDHALRRKDRRQDYRQDLVRALAEGGSASSELRDQIVDVFSRILDDDKALALSIAIAARDWDETRLDQQLSAILDMDDVDPVTRFVIQTKLSSADESHEQVLPQGN